MRPELAARIAARDEVLARLRDVLIDRMRLRRAPDELDPDAPLFGAGFALDSLDRAGPDPRASSAGLDGAALPPSLRRRAARLDATVADLSPTHAFVCLDGPYAWELLADVTAPDVIGLPYLGFFHEGRFTCFRG